MWFTGGLVSSDSPSSHRLWTSPRPPFLHHNVVLHQLFTLQHTPQSIDRDGTGRVNKELEVQQGK